jgi:hypothetical protein
VVKRVYRAKDVSRINPKLRLMDSLNEGVERNGLNIENARMCVHDRDRCGRVVHSKHVWAP